MTNKEILRKQIIYRSMHRGSKEMDLLLGYFVKKNIDKTEVEYSNFTEMYQGIKLFHYSMDDARKVHVQRDVLGKV